MNFTIEDALILAAEAHRGQVDQAGVPYIYHLMRVSNLAPVGYRIPAILHDILEDTEETEGTLEAWGVNFDDRAIIRQVTRLNEWTAHRAETYKEFITRICNQGSIGAIKVKLADLRDHLENPNPIRDSAKRQRLTARYFDARRKLQDELQLRGHRAW